MSDQQILIDCSAPQLADGIQTSPEEMAKIRVNSIANAIGLTTGVAPKARIDDRETANGVTKYHNLVLSIEELLLLDQATLSGLQVEITVGAFIGSYTNKSTGDEGLAKLQSLLG